MSQFLCPTAELAASRGGATGNPNVAHGSPATGDTLGMLADVLQRADKRAGELAEAADASRIADSACERAYDSLTPTAK